MPEEPRNAQDTELSMTRRNFFRMAGGSLAALPTVAGGYLVETAYAEEADGEYSQESDGGAVEWAL